MRHTINRQIFELNCSSEDSAKSVSEEIANYVIAPFTDIISGVLESIDVEGRMLMIDKIDIDLGDLEPEEIESVSTQEKFKQLLEAEIRKQVSGNEAVMQKEMSRRGQASAKNSYEILDHWLRKGDLPWWAEKLQTLSIERIFKNALSENPSAVHDLINDIPHELLFTRLISKLTVTSQHKLAGLVPAAGSEIVSRSLIEKVFEESVGDGLRKWLSQRLRQFRRSENTLASTISLKAIAQKLNEEWHKFDGKARKQFSSAAQKKILPTQRKLEMLSAHQQEFIEMILRVLTAGDLLLISNEGSLEKKFRFNSIDEVLEWSVLSSDISTSGHLSRLQRALQDSDTVSTLQDRHSDEHNTKTADAADVAAGFHETDSRSDLLTSGETTKSISEKNASLQSGEEIIHTTEIRNTHDDIETQKMRDTAADWHKSETEQRSSSTTESAPVGISHPLAMEMSNLFSEITEKLQKLAGTSPASDQARPMQTTKRMENLVQRGPENGSFQKTLRQLATIFSQRRQLYSNFSAVEAALPKEPEAETGETIADKTRDGEKQSMLSTQEIILPEKAESSRNELMDYMVSRLEAGSPAIRQLLETLPHRILDLLASGFKKQDSHNRRLAKDLNSFLKNYPLSVVLEVLKIYSPSVKPSGKKNASGKREIIAMQTSGVPDLKLNTDELFLFNELDTTRPAGAREEVALMKKLLRKLPEEGKEFISFLSGTDPTEVKSLYDTTPEETSPISFPNDRQAVTGANEKLYIENAGLCLIAVYLGGFFKQLGYTEKGKFKNKTQASRAVQLLQFVATGKKKTAEYQLQLNKILCGISIFENIHPNIRLRKQETDEAEQVIGAVLEHWTTLKSTSIDGFRTSFLQRKGILEEDDLKFTLRVEKQGFDMLLNTIPWGYTLIKLPWMKKHLQVEW